MSDDETAEAQDSDQEKRIVHGVDIALLEEVLDEIRPVLIDDGGDMRFHGVDKRGIVSVELIGACGTCPLSTMTLTFGIEAIVVKKVPGVTGVVACSPAIAPLPELSR